MLPEPLTPLRWLETLARPQTQADFSRAGRADSASWRREDRRMPFHIVYFFLQGRCQGQISGQPVQLDPGSFLWLPPGTRHELEQDPATLRLRHLHLTFTMRREEREWTLREPILLKSAPEVRGPFLELITEVQLGEAGRSASPYRVHRLQALAQLFFAAVFDQSHSGTDSIRRLSHSQCLRLQERMADLTVERVAPRQLARELGLSPRYFTLLFRATFGCSPRVWLTRQRIHRAAEMIQDSRLTFSEMADRLGYADLFLFSRQFKEVLGVSPRAYRHRLEMPIASGRAPSPWSEAAKVDQSKQLELFERE